MTVVGGAKATARGAAWNYGAQIATVIAQLGYAAVTSRLMPSKSFGEYGVALTVAALLTMMATAGLPQAVARLQVLERSRITGLLLYALGVGVVAAAVLLLTASFWADVWGAPGSAPVLRVLAINAFFYPLLALGIGLHIRTRRFRALATTTFVTNVGGMVVGLVLVASLRTSPTLVASVIVAQAAAAIVLLGSNRHLFGRTVSWAAIGVDARFSGRTTISALLAYLAGNAGKFFLSNARGPVLLGHWNRAEVITTTPFFQIQSALTQALYPEFREDEGHADRARRIWADLLGLVAWICLPVAAVLAPVTAVIIPVVFGGGWTAVAVFTPALAVLGAVQTIVFVLVGALEVLARFRWVWAGHIVALLINSVGAVVAVVAGDPRPALFGVVLGLSGMHAVHVVLCHRAGLLQVRPLLRHYAGALLFSGGLGALTWLVLRAPALAGGRPWVLLVIAAAAVVALSAVWRLRRRLPILLLAARYGLLPARLVKTFGMV